MQSKMPMNITFRELVSPEDHAACVELQRETWGRNFTEVTPPTLMTVARKIGGVIAGAFDEQGRLLGFIFSIVGLVDGRVVHWSQKLAVRKEVRGQGLGIQLKLYQREFVLKLGIEHIYWTYDPLVARNAHMNLNRLGATIDKFVVNMYASDTGSELHRGIGTDRFLVDWPIAEKRVTQAIARQTKIDPNDFTNLRIVNTEMGTDGQPVPIAGELPELPELRVEVPPDIELMLVNSPERAVAWRENTRRVFLWYQEQGYEVTRFCRHGERCFYALSR